MKKELLIPYNIQFFAEDAEGDSVETPDVADPGMDEGEPDEVQTVQTPDENALYADARRRAEAEANARFQRQQAEMDNRVASMFGNYTHPTTGQPIRTMSEYLDAIEIQERNKVNQQMQEAGVDPSIIDRAVANSPLMRQAQFAIDQASNINAQRALDADFAEIMRLDPSLNSVADIQALPNFPDMVAYCARTGASAVDAYKVMNFDRIMQAKTGAATQAAINSAKSKGHMANVGGIVNEDGSVDIPAAELQKWQDWYPEKSKKELKALYNKAMKLKGE